MALDITTADRFIPVRAALSGRPYPDPDVHIAKPTPYENLLAQRLLNLPSASTREPVLTLANRKRKAAALPLEDLFPVAVKTQRIARTFNTRPVDTYKIPQLPDDFYRNLIAVSRHQLIAAANGKEIFLKKLFSSKGVQIKPDLNAISAISFNVTGNRLLAGGTNGELQMWDLHNGGPQIDFNYTELAERAISVITPYSDNCLIVGSKEGWIQLLDLRLPEEEAVVNLWDHSKQPICGIAHNKDHSIAAGCNDNSVSLIDMREAEKVHLIKEHTAAVKGLCFLNRHTLATGGGTSDRTIRVWDVRAPNPALLSKLDVYSQVTNIFHLATRQVLVLTLGYNSNNVVFIDTSQGTGLEKAEQTATKNFPKRPLYAAAFPDESHIVSSYTTPQGDGQIEVYKVPDNQKKIPSLFEKFQAATLIR